MTGDKITVKKLISVIEGLPEKKFLITELTHEVMGTDGKVDMGKALVLQQDINMAITEIKRYIQSANTLKAMIMRAKPSIIEADADFMYDDYFLEDEE